MQFKASAILETVGMPAVETVRSLAKDEALSFFLKGNATIYSLAGTLWVTLEGKGEDILIEAGESRTVEGRGHLVVSALADSRFWIC